MDRLEALRILVRVVESGSFSAAARELGVGQPAISKQIAALEAEVGTRLLHRTSRSHSVTQAGAALYADAARLVAELDAALAKAGGREALPSGLLRVTVAPVFGRLYLVPRLPELFARYPKLSVELLVSSKTVNLVEENVDLAIRGGPLEGASLLARPLGASPLLTVASSAYLAKHGEPAAPQELGAHRCITFVGRGGPRAFRYAGGLVHQPAGSFRSNDAEQIRAAVLEGLGLAQVPGWLIAPELQSGAVRAVLAAHQPEPIPLTAVRPAGRRLPARVRAFLDFLAEGFAREPMLRAGSR
jgi:LysR family transcriptional regulator for bpeEF and oprC